MRFEEREEDPTYGEGVFHLCYTYLDSKTSEAKVTEECSLQSVGEEVWEFCIQAR